MDLSSTTVVEDWSREFKKRTEANSPRRVRVGRSSSAGFWPEWRLVTLLFRPKPLFEWVAVWVGRFRSFCSLQQFRGLLFNSSLSFYYLCVFYSEFNAFYCSSFCSTSVHSSVHSSVSLLCFTPTTPRQSLGGFWKSPRGRCLFLNGWQKVSSSPVLFKKRVPNKNLLCSNSYAELLMLFPGDSWSSRVSMLDYVVCLREHCEKRKHICPGNSQWAIPNEYYSLSSECSFMAPIWTSLQWRVFISLQSSYSIYISLILRRKYFLSLSFFNLKLDLKRFFDSILISLPNHTRQKFGLNSNFEF